MNVRKANWPLFQETLADIPDKDSLDEMEDRLVTAFHQAADTAIPKTKPTNRHHKNGWYYNKEMKEQNNRINRARKLNRKYNIPNTKILLRATINMAKKVTN